LENPYFSYGQVAYSCVRKISDLFAYVPDRKT